MNKPITATEQKRRENIAKAVRSINAEWREKQARKRPTQNPAKAGRKTSGNF